MRQNLRAAKHSATVSRGAIMSRWERGSDGATAGERLSVEKFRVENPDEGTPG